MVRGPEYINPNLPRRQPVMKNIRSVAARAAAGAAAMSVLLGSVAGAAAAQGSGAKGDIDLAVPAGATIAVGGSSFSAPLYTYFTTSSSAGAYKPTTSVTFGTDSAAGSGDGRTKVTAGTYTIGMSDQPMDATAGTLPTGTHAADLVNYVQIPWALGGAVVGYHLAGLNNLKLSASVIAQIYNGKITNWNDDQIAALNHGVTLPNKTILVCYRNASSGTTYAFTDYLAKATQGRTPSGASGSVMEGTGKLWGATNVSGESNNAAMANDLANTDGSIGYLEYSYVLANPGKIQAAKLQDAAGTYIAPSLTNIAAAATAAAKTISASNFSITYLASGKTAVWPLATYTWAILAKSQTNAANGELAVKFLDYATQGGQKFAGANGFVALPTAVQKADRAALLTVKSGTKVLLTQKA